MRSSTIKATQTTDTLTGLYGNLKDRVTEYEYYDEEGLAEAEKLMEESKLRINNECK
jgi:hypothetical protein